MNGGRRVYYFLNAPATLSIISPAPWLTWTTPGPLIIAAREDGRPEYAALIH